MNLKFDHQTQINPARSSGICQNKCNNFGGFRDLILAFIIPKPPFSGYTVNLYILFYRQSDTGEEDKRENFSQVEFNISVNFQTTWTNFPFLGGYKRPASSSARPDQGDRYNWRDRGQRGQRECGAWPQVKSGQEQDRSLRGIPQWQGGKKK